MRQLVIIGNGFDLAHGLKTSYKDFVLWYLNDIIQSLRTKYQYSDKLVTLFYKGNFRFPEGGLLTDVKQFVEMTKAEKYRFEREVINENLMDLLRNMYNNWVDIEAFYYEQLVKLYKLNKTPPRGRDVTKELKELNQFMEGIKESLIRYLKSLESPNWNGEIASRLNDRILEQNKGFDTMFVNFNYTNTLEMYSSADAEQNRMNVYIHGNISDPQNPVIFGYGDEVDKHFKEIEETGNDLYLENIKSYWYLKTSNYRDVINFINGGDYQVRILGHSCGLSDRVLLSEIFTHERCKDIDILYYDKGDGDNDYTEKCYAISRQFPLEFKASMRNKIIPFDKSEPLVRFKNNQ